MRRASSLSVTVSLRNEEQVQSLDYEIEYHRKASTPPHANQRASADARVRRLELLEHRHREPLQFPRYDPIDCIQPISEVALALGQSYLHLHFNICFNETFP